MTRTLWNLTVLFTGLLSIGAAIGCAGRPGADEELSAEESARIGSGYYEVNHEGTTYVVGSAEAAANVKQGKVPKQTSTRYSAGGKRVLIEASDHTTRARLEHEYDRRHVLNKTQF